MKNLKNKTSLRTTRFWIWESVTRKEGVNSLQRPSEGGTLIKNAKSMWFQNVNFPQK